MSAIRAVAGHWEKAALAGSVAFGLGHLFIGGASSRAEVLVEEAQTLTYRLDAALRRDPDGSEAGDVRRLRARLAFDRPADAVGGDAWAYYKPVTLDVRLVPENVPTVKPRTILPTRLISVEAAVEGVTLAWTDDPANEVPARGYHVYRREAGAGGFTRLTTEPVAGTTYVDAAAAPDTEYAYAVAAVVGGGDVTAAPSGEGPRSAERMVRMPEAFRLALKGIKGGELPLADVEVSRFAYGRWWRKAYVVREGDPIGRPESFWWEGRRVPVDMSTGCVVTRIESVKVKRTRDRLTYSAETWKLTYRDDEGTTREVMIE